MPVSDSAQKQTQNYAAANKNTADQRALDDILKIIGIRDIKKLANSTPLYQGFLGFLCLLAGNELEGFERIKDAASKNNHISVQLVQYLEKLSHSEKLKSTTQKVVEWLAIKATFEDALQSEATFRLSLAYLFGKGKKQDNKRAIALLSEAAIATHPLAQFILAKIYDEGKITPKNDVLASIFFSVAAQQEIVEAQVAIADRLAKGIGITPSSSESFLWRVKAAHNGDTENMFYLGDAYEYGKGVTQDVLIAYGFYCCAASLGHTQAKTRSAFILLRDANCTLDDCMVALCWLEEAIDLDDPEALFLMATFYHSGVMQPMVAVNHALAIAHLKRSVALDFAPAKKLVFEKNIDIGVAPRQVEKWIKELALNGDIEAKELLVNALEKQGKKLALNNFLKQFEKSQTKNQLLNEIKNTDDKAIEETTNKIKSFLPQFSGSLPKPTTHGLAFGTKLEFLSSKISQIKLN